MIDWFPEQGDGHTDLSEEERRGLIPTYIATRADLYDAEQRNIAQVLLRRTPTAAVLLDDVYLRALHQDMFGDVWSWAGKYRTHDTNIGVSWEQISMAIRDLVDDTAVWIEHATYEPDEIAIRFHHRLVSIHPFSNGNGRHSRIAADYLIRSLGHPPFSWGVDLDLDVRALRSEYIVSLQAADAQHFDQLRAFARS